jgi:hypothetical protein
LDKEGRKMKIKNALLKMIRYFSLLCVIIFGLTAIIGSNGGGGGGGGNNGDDNPPPLNTTAPNAPVGLEASDGDHMDFIRLSWTSTDRADGYDIYWADSWDGVYTEFATTSTTSYDDYDGGDGTTYYFKIKAFNDYGESPFSSYDSGYSVPVCGGSWEPNSYTGIAVNHSYNDQECFSSPSDKYYKIYLIKNRDYSFTINMVGLTDNPDLYLYSSHEEELDKSRNGMGLGESIDYSAPCTGYYYLRVNNWFGDYFTFSIHFYEN